MSTSSYDPYFNPALAPADTPVGAEDRLEEYQKALEEATTALTKARDAELDAEEARDDAERRARFSAACPKAGVFGGVRTTVAYVEAWIKEEARNEEHAYRLAREARRAASDHLRKLMKQGGWQQSITASVRENFRGTSGRRYS